MIGGNKQCNYITKEDVSPPTVTAAAVMLTCVLEEFARLPEFVLVSTIALIGSVRPNRCLGVTLFYYFRFLFVTCKNYGVKRQGNLLTEILLSCQYVSTSVRQYVSTSVCQYVSTRYGCSTSVRQYISTPVRQYVSTSVRHYAVWLQYISTSVRQYLSTPVHQYISTSVSHVT